MADLVNLSVGNAAVIALLGYCVVFFGIILLMCVVLVMAKIYMNKAKKAQAVAAEAPAVEAPEVKGEPAPGSAGELKLYDTDPRDAAMIMAIVADKLGKPINELRFKSIREIKDDEV